ncbi:hypothetical protein CSB20_10120 [bacterium DOLZORAL124_64_63]|nr:MAG: hypothetical protein CSB20_10120 [bacterium DOLZORAL124_64_63]
MRKKTAYGIQTRGDRYTAVGLVPEDDGRWRITTRETGTHAAGPGLDLRRAIGSKGTPLGLVLNRKTVRNALTSFPRLKRKELDKAVHGWVAREEGTPVADWQVAWTELQRPEPDPENTDVFLLYCPKWELQAFQQRIAGWGGQISRIIPEFTVLDQMYRQYGSGRHDLQGWNLVYVTAQEQFLCVANHEGMILTRELPADLNEGGNRQEHIERLATEVDRSLFFARQTEYNPRIDRVVVCGEAGLAADLVALLNRDTSVPAELWDLNTLFTMPEGEWDETLILPAMAAVLASGKGGLNLQAGTGTGLLPPVLRRRLALAAVTAAWTLVPLLTVGGLVTSRIQDHYLDAAQVRMQEALVRAEEAKQVYQAEKLLEDKENHIRQAARFQRDYAGVLLHLASLTPDEIVFKDLRLGDGTDGEPRIYLTGESTSNLVEDAQQAFIAFQGALGGSPLLTPEGEPRKLVISAERQGGGMRKKVEFSMECGIRQGTAVPVEEPAVALREEN